MDYNIVKYNFLNDSYKNIVQQSFTNYMTKYALNLSYVCCIFYKQKIIFISRLYYLTKKYKLLRGYPDIASYELGDVFLFDDYKGKKILNKIKNFHKYV